MFLRMFIFKTNNLPVAGLSLGIECLVPADYWPQLSTAQQSTGQLSTEQLSAGQLLPGPAGQPALLEDKIVTANGRLASDWRR